jgi:hypothetical protein
MFNVHKNQPSRQTGSRNMMGPKTLPTIWGTYISYMKLVTKYQISNTGLTIFDFVGMMIESMAGKSASLHGTCYDATPFTYTEDTPPIDYMGKTLSAGKKSFFSNEASDQISTINSC